MNQSNSTPSVFRFDSIVFELALKAVSMLAFFSVIGALAWIGWSEATNVVAFSVLAAGLVIFLQLFSREKLFLAEDSNTIEIAAGEKALLRTLERFNSDSDWLRAAVAAAGAGVGIAAGMALIWANVGPILPTCCAGMVTFFVVLYAFILWDQRLARDYVQRGYQAFLANDFSAAMGDASECIILSLVYRYEAYVVRGLVWTRLGNFDRAIAEFNLALNERAGTEALSARQSAVRMRAELADGATNSPALATPIGVAAGL